eukprot:TRINITY_DN671_c0_g1_i2.p1 TRINITY_DN671_c0_g1~~TRINITY_DN671_c0_g1_i2.p1  ORF type:complete len:373 (+),score=104.62 TRINITY_DN671_c0_g1_i2:193-1311(+)
MSSPSKPGIKYGDRHSGVKAPTRPDEPKKGGAGGKGTWGVAGCEIKGSVTDRHDPNYDSEEDSRLYVPRPLPPIVNFKSNVQTILDEFFVSGDVDEVARALPELGQAEFHHEFVKIAVSRAMERHDRERELVSSLLPSLYPEVLSSAHIAEGFTAVLERLQDLRLDSPAAPDLLACFLARAVIDDILPPVFLSTDTADEELAKDTLEKAYGMTRGKHAAARLEQVWGPGAGQSVKRLKERIALILEEYLAHPDALQVDRAVRELHSPHFHYQVAKKAAQMAIESSKSSDRDRVNDLLAQLHKSGLVSQEHMEGGFRIVADLIGDIELDAPAARSQFVDFVAHAIRAGYLPSSFQDVAARVSTKPSGQKAPSS